MNFQKLDPIELRVLGVLIEKSLTQAGSYPLTMNAIVLGANQKQNRDPVLSLSEGEVARALGSLERKQLVAQAPPAPGARANRFQHRVVNELRWDRRDQAIMAELMLRGRQTAGELRTHASRMTSFADIGSVLNTLQELAAREPSFVEELPREPGRSANRWRHLIGAIETAAKPVGAARSGPGSAAQTGTGEVSLEHPQIEMGNEASLRPNSPLARGSERPSEIVALRDRIEHLESRVAALAKELEDLRNATYSSPHSEEPLV